MNRINRVKESSCIVSQVRVGWNEEVVAGEIEEAYLLLEDQDFVVRLSTESGLTKKTCV